MKILKTSKLGIIFAVVLTMVTTIAFTACNSEDDFGGDLDGNITGQYSLATRMMTRAGEGGGYAGDGTYILGGDTTIYDINIGGFAGEANVSWEEGYTGNRSPQSRVNATISLREYEKTDYTTNITTKISLNHREVLWNDSGNGIVVRQDYEIKASSHGVDSVSSKGCYTLTVLPSFKPGQAPNN